MLKHSLGVIEAVYLQNSDNFSLSKAEENTARSLMNLKSWDTVIPVSQNLGSFHLETPMIFSLYSGFVAEENRLRFRLLSPAC